MDAVEVNKDYIINRQGKDYILYAGRDGAHRNGLKGITTHLVQVGGPDNGGVTVCEATVKMEHGDFTGHGEVGKLDSKIAMAAPIRMAETRAKARAFRDALNASQYTLEGEEEDVPAAEHPKRSTPAWPKDSDEGPPAEGSLPVRSIGSVIQEAAARHPDKVKVTAPGPDGRPEHDRADTYAGRDGAAKVPAPYDSDPAKLELAHNAWDQLITEARAKGMDPSHPSGTAWASVSMMRAEYQKLRRAMSSFVPNTPPADDAPPPSGE